VAAERPDLISRVVVVGPAAAAVLPRRELAGSGVLAASDSVAEMILQMLSTDPRAALSSVIATINPELDEEQLRERVDRVAAYQTAGGADRVAAWMNDDVSEQARSLGDRLWILHAGEERLYEGALGDRVRKLFPKAHLEELPHGPVSRPDLTAAWVRRLTGVPAARS
jgi:pimeloyl-ACP methyl ester carboxylesterase